MNITRENPGMRWHDNDTDVVNCRMNTVFCFVINSKNKNIYHKMEWKNKI